MGRREKLVYHPCHTHRIITCNEDGVTSQTCEGCGAEWFFEGQPTVTDAEMTEVADRLMELWRYVSLGPDTTSTIPAFMPLGEGGYDIDGQPRRYPFPFD